jgi:predicted MFS family arabinose efflux permease
LVALFCAQFLYGALVLSALHKQYLRPMRAVQALICEDLGNRLGLITRLGKEPARIEGLDRILTSYASEQVDSLLVLDVQGVVLAGWGRPRGHVFALPDAPEDHDRLREFSQDAALWSAKVLTDRVGTPVGHVLLGMDEADLTQRIRPILYDNLRLLGGITVGAAVALIVLVLTIGSDTGYTNATLPRKRLYAGVILPLVAGQILFALAMTTPLREINEQHLRTVAEQLGRHLGGELEHLLGLGLELEQFPPLENHLAGLQRNLPEVRGLAVSDIQGRLIQAADAAGGLTQGEWTQRTGLSIITEVPLLTPQGFPAGRVSVLMSPAAVSANLRAITLDTLTMTVVAALFLAELTGLLMLREERTLRRPARGISARYMRPVIFICIFAIDMSLSFVPLRLAELDPHLLGLPPDVVMSLPVSFEMFMVGLAIVLGGFLSERSGWRPLLLTGTVIAALGNLACGLTAGPLMYIGARGMAGAGYGCINLAAQVFVLAHSAPDRRAGNLAVVFAGLFAGALCGSAAGGLIADRLGYAATFRAAALLLAVTGAVLWRALPREHGPAPRSSSAQPLPGVRQVLDFFTNPRMAALLFLNIVPGAFVTVCLFQFFVPVSLNRGGASPADIGRVTMIFPLVIVYLGPLLATLVDRSHRKYLHLGLAGMIGALAVGILLVMDGFPAATLAVVLLGLSNAVLSNAQGAYALELPPTTRFGASRAMGVYNVVERLGQVIGPVSMGVIFSLWGREAGLGCMALGLAAMSLVFIVVCHMRRNAIS